MAAKRKSLFKAIILLFVLTNHTPAEAQLTGWLKKQKDKIINKIDSVAGNKVDKLINGKDNNGQSKPGAGSDNRNGAGNTRPKGSLIKDEDFVQNLTNPPRDSNNTRVMIAKNLYVDIKGRYPQGYSPKWRFIGTPAELDFDVDDYVFPSTYQKHEKKAVALLDYEGKAVLAYNAFVTCDCYAEIKIDSFTVLTDKPQIFRVTNFQKVLNGKMTGEKCRSDWNSATYANGGFEGKITLSANDNGDIVMSLIIENYSQETTSNNYDPATRSYPTKVNPPSVSFRYTAKSIVLNSTAQSKTNYFVSAQTSGKFQDPSQRNSVPATQASKNLNNLKDINANTAAIAKCISGDCQNGYGIQESSEFHYEGNFKNGKFDGNGTYTYLKSWYKYYVGGFKEGKFSGKGTLVKQDNEKISMLNWIDGEAQGLGTISYNGIPRIGVYNNNFEIAGYVPLEVIKHHLDTTFARFKKCNLLTPTKVNLQTIGAAPVDYDIIDAYGHTVGKKTELEEKDGSMVLDGFANNTKDTIFIKAYRKYVSTEKGVVYFDESVGVPPGGKISDAYWHLPEPGEILSLYFDWAKDVVYLGQYIRK